MNKFKLLKQCIMLSIVLCSIIFSISMASAADVTYYWDRTNGVSIAGYTTNWTSCSSPQNGFRVAILKDSTSSCRNGLLSISNAGDMLLSISPTAYSSDMQITGKTNAKFYLRSNSGSATYRFDLGYAQESTFTSLGNVTKTRVSTSGTTYTIDMSTISGVVPAGSNLALKISVITSTGGRIYLGANGGTKNSNSGRFYVSETVVTSTPLNIVAQTDITTGATDTSTPVTLGTPTITGGVLPYTTTNNAPPGGFPVGSTTVIWTTTDLSGVTATDTQLVTITAQPPLTGDSQIKVSANRYVVLDDPNTGTAGTGFSNPNRNWGTSYWSGESTTIRSTALVVDNTGKPKSGVTVNFNLKNPGGSSVSTASSSTNVDGIAYYSFNLNEKKYWGNWIIETSATIDGSAKQSSTTFVLDWWGCASCHNSEDPGNWGSYTPKSYYTMGYSFHKDQSKKQHTSPMSSGNCAVCHRSYDKSSDWHTGKVACAGCHAGSDISSTPQRKNPEIAGCYDTAGCHPKKNTNLEMEDSTTGYVVGGNYKTKYSSIPTNSAKSHTTGSVECILCHNSGHSIKKPYNDASSSNSNTENDQCWACHTSRATTHKSNTNCVGCHNQDAHNISTAGGGGPDCISCHDTTGSATHKVDVNAIASGEHANLNSAASAVGVSAANKKCWGCHQSGGTQPAGDSMGDRYTNPYKCYDCHNATKPYTNVVGALTVSEHFKSGTDIQSAISASDNSTSCVICHNISEMKVSYTEIDGLNNGSSLASHYGKNRGELRTGEGGSTDCKYCHQNGSTAFSIAMSNTENKNMVNHSTSASTPVCTTCHNTGKLHNSSLSKPASSNDTYCKTCHATKSEHKTLYCTECHANNSVGDSAGRDIHGIKYLQKDNTFSTEKTNATNCTTCHQSNVVDGSIGITPVKISNPLHHSDDVLNGSKWGSYWADQASACLYCHNDTKHSATPLGRPLVWNTSYVLNTPIGTGTNCADCHYQGDGNYGVMSSAFTGAGLNISPEITSGSWNGKPGYYNHTLGDYTDSQCKSCHDKSGSTTVGQIMHNASVGSSGGPDCKACHDAGGSAPSLVNFSAANNSGHKNLNSGASSTVDGENKKCWACHGDGTQPGSGHPSAYMTPAPCENCHAGTGGYSAPLVKEHNQNGSDVQTTAACVLCHDNNGMFIDSAGIGTITHYIKNVTDTTTTPYGHSGTINTTNCIICHRGQYTNDPTWGSPVNISTSSKRQHTETTNTQCDTCHKDSSVQTLANVDFHNSALTAGAGGTNCLACHAGAE